jgi:uncharacterized membrane protein YozB (DUF420 family)
VSTSETLAVLDTLFAAAAAVCLIAGHRAIRRRDITRHRNCMLGAFAGSAAFLGLFVVRFVTFGFRYQGRGAARVVYYVLLFAHEPLAVISVPLACATLVLGLRRSRFHVEMAKPTLVIWLISCATGAVLFLFLHTV